MSHMSAPGPVTVVTQQPMAIQQTVVIAQPQGTMWSSGICSCFDDIKSCCCALWFGNCYYACISSRMGENCCVGCSGYPSGCVPGGHLAMRAAFRNKHGIAGSICDDCCTTTCCLPFAMCQISRQMDFLGYPQKDSCC
ncbi:placenta-specific gene 8 protein-like isoform X2 [Styela clava]|uniref:placenta-specific gene 8 protein-like isoform X2 n=1 Tax=Styela clava TaxID=7725 RepID=UPI001939365C|nr:placenta-specific gene 8 protein-like isoform X2 [Styela clava]